MDKVGESEDRQQKAKEYARQRRWLMAAQVLLGLAYVLALIFGGLSVRLRGALALSLPQPMLLLAGLFLVIYLGYEILSLPLSIYSSYVLPHRYGLSVQSLSSWLADAGKGLGLSVLFGLVGVQVLYWLMAALPVWWWLVAGLLALGFEVLLTVVAPVLLMPLFYTLRPLQDSDLAGRLERMAAGAGARVRGVYVIEFSRKTTAANAALVGLGGTRRIVLGDTLLDSFARPEIEVVFAHELGHHVHGDIRRLLVIRAALMLVSLYLVSLLLPMLGPLLGLGGLADPGTLPLLALVLGGFGLVTMPLANGFSRLLEKAADEYALRVTDDPQSFRSAMSRLASQNLAEQDPAGWVVFLLYSHPPVRERIRHADEYAGRRISGP